MRWTGWFGVVLLGVVLCLAGAALAQDRVELGPVELIVPGAPDDASSPNQDATTATSWRERLTPAARMGVIAAIIGIPMLVVLLGRAWRRLHENDRAVILLCAAMGRGRGFRNRVRSLAGGTGPGGRPITPVAMLLAPRAFDEALANATHAERAYGQPLRHAVHGFRKH